VTNQYKEAKIVINKVKVMFTPEQSMKAQRGVEV
jgi:hypothetical protein